MVKIPIRLTLYGHVQVETDNKEQALLIISKMPTPKLRKYFKEEFCYIDKSGENPSH